jgi:hypothetical protein
MAHGTNHPTTTTTTTTTTAATEIVRVRVVDTRKPAPLDDLAAHIRHSLDLPVRTHVGVVVSVSSLVVCESIGC